MIALLNYACDYDDANDGMGWPDDIGIADSSGTRTWQHFLINNLIEVLPKLVPVSA